MPKTLASNFLRALLLLASAAVTLPATAQTQQRSAKPAKPPVAEKKSAPSSPEWTKEPTALMGIQLGVALSEQTNVITACPVTGGSFPGVDWRGAGLCYHYPYKELPEAIVYNTPSLGFEYDLRIATINGFVHGATLHVKPFAKDMLLDVLETRYGAPTDSRMADFTNGLGIGSKAVVHYWEGKKARMMLSPYGGLSGDAFMRLSTVESSTLEDSERTRKAAASAGKL